LLLAVGHARADVKVEFSDAVKAAVDPRTQEDIQKIVNAGLQKLGEKDPGAKALFESNQTIKILAFGEDQANKLGLVPAPVPAVDLGVGKTMGDFNPNGTPRAGGTTRMISWLPSGS
jgi:hypothetical protein